MPLAAKIDHRLDIEASSVAPGSGALAALNLVQITGSQLRVARDAIAHISGRSGADMMAQAQILSGLVDEIGLPPCAYASAALHARAVAVDRWLGQHGQINADAAFEAAARAPLIETEQGAGFDAPSFCELVDFVAELPF